MDSKKIVNGWIVNDSFTIVMDHNTAMLRCNLQVVNHPVWCRLRCLCSHTQRSCCLRRKPTSCRLSSRQSANMVSQ